MMIAIPRMGKKVENNPGCKDNKNMLIPIKTW